MTPLQWKRKQIVTEYDLAKLTLEEMKAIAEPELSDTKDAKRMRAARKRQASYKKLKLT